MPKKRKYNKKGPNFPPKLEYLDENGKDIIDEITIREVNFLPEEPPEIHIDLGEMEEEDGRTDKTKRSK